MIRFLAVGLVYDFDSYFEQFELMCTIYDACIMVWTAFFLKKFLKVK